VKRMTKAEENLTPMAHAAQNRCFGCGEANPSGLHLEFFLADDHSVVSLPAIPDGGIIATLLDEAMSKSIRAQGFTAMTRQMEVEYLHPVPSRAQLRLEGRITRNEGRKHWAEAILVDTEGATLARGKGLFIEVRPR